MTESTHGEETFQPGDVVQLKSMGPAMTVYAVKEDGVHCLWYAESNDEVKTEIIPAICLEKIIDLDDDEDEDEDEDEDDEDEDEED